MVFRPSRRRGITPAHWCAMVSTVHSANAEAMVACRDHESAAAELASANAHAIKLHASLSTITAPHPTTCVNERAHQ